jgi:hypothetical protein
MPAIAIGPTIPAGESFSDAVAIGGKQLFMIISPPDWTPANLTFEVSTSSGAFFPLFFSGRLWEIACPPNAALLLNALAVAWPKGALIKFMSGTPDNPVVQEADRVFQLLTV